MMKKCILFAALAAALLSSCARAPQPGLNDASKAYLEAWVKVHYPDAKTTPMGAYILDETPGTGEPLGDVAHSPFVRVNYTVRSLDGTISATNSEVLAKQLGTYKDVNFYGPKFWTRPGYGVRAGVEEALSTMNIGGSKTVLIPGWLLSKDPYGTAEEYFKKAQGTEAIYTIEPVERITDIAKWEVDSLCSFMRHNYPSVALTDSLKNGFYYVRTSAPSDTTGFRKDTTIYINYIGRLLNGTVFDTSIADTAKFYGIYEAKREYGPQKVDAKEDYTSTTMGGEKIIDGFAYTIYQMHSFEKGTGIFCSEYGYKLSGSGESIPPYSPLRFDIEVVKEN